MINGHFWPVWKNIYTDQHLRNCKIPINVKNMQGNEADSNDYREACKRCFLYFKRNFEEEIHPDMVDYVKGSWLIIIEELLRSLENLPKLYIKLIDFVQEFMTKGANHFEQIYMQRLDPVI